MTVLGESVSYHHKYKFRVIIDDFSEARFMTCSAIKMNVAKVEVWEGGALTAHKEPGRLTYDDVTLTRGVTRNQDCYNWLKSVVTAHKNAGSVSPDYKRNVEVVQEDRDGSTLRRWVLENAWPVEFHAGDWDNSADEAVVETLVLTYEIARQPED